jgi:hypothetical protein
MTRDLITMRGRYRSTLTRTHRLDDLALGVVELAPVVIPTHADTG